MHRIPQLSRFLAFLALPTLTYYFCSLLFVLIDQSMCSRSKFLTFVISYSYPSATREALPQSAPRLPSPSFAIKCHMSIFSLHSILSIFARIRNHPNFLLVLYGMHCWHNVVE